MAGLSHLFVVFCFGFGVNLSVLQAVQQREKHQRKCYRILLNNLCAVAFSRDAGPAMLKELPPCCCPGAVTLLGPCLEMGLKWGCGAVAPHYCPA